jgi:cellulose biosynthesis protein BcsQ/tetratricopeptide (TPR) repeat protein
MYVTTFYSYKGGVGRTMALVNVATLLATGGKRVLVVDFDLEAPGVSSFAPFSCSRGLPGLVDYVQEYQRDLVAPRVEDFLVGCDFQDTKIWIMPAGANNSAGYSEKLSGIDWERLYTTQSGYLMMEDMKQQWASYEGVGFDYVFIDSRTGHTDVGGICTRQLPDAVVVLFVPSDQNVDGLVPIVEGIRDEERRTNRPIRLHFCPSNLPDEYDEDEVLSNLLENAAVRLGYANPPGLALAPTLIHHWTSVAILDDPLVAISRPRSKLAMEFGTLRRAIIAHNYADREGALANLKRIPSLYRKERKAGDSRAINEIAATLAEIVRLHPADGEIAMGAAESYSLIGDYEQEVASLSTAIAQNVSATRARLHRAAALVSLDRKDDALDDIRAVITARDGTNFEFQPAIQLLRALSKDSVSAARDIFVKPTTRMRAKLQLVPLLTQQGGDFDVVAKILMKEFKRSDLDAENRTNVANALSLALIRAGRFAEVLEEVLPDRQDGHVALTFNRAIAEWALTGEVPSDLFQRFVADASMNKELEANGFQCIALARSALGDREGALSDLEKARLRATRSTLPFSCWTYETRTRSQFMSDLDAMKASLKKGIMLKPPFLN